MRIFPSYTECFNCQCVYNSEYNDVCPNCGEPQ